MANEQVDLAHVHLSNGVMAAAKARLNRQAPIEFGPVGNENSARGSYIQFSRLRDETENLLLDLVDARRCREEGRKLSYFLVPHRSLFDAYAAAKDLSELHFGLEDSEQDPLTQKEILFQLEEVFNFSHNLQGKENSHRNILFDVSVEEIRRLLQSHTGDAIDLDSKLSVITESRGHSTEELVAVAEEIRRIASGVWQHSILAQIKLRQKIKTLSGFIDQDIGEQLNNLLTVAILQGEKNSRLGNIFRLGSLFRVNSCPGLPASVRSIYRSLSTIEAFNRSYRILSSQIHDLIEHVEADVAVFGGRGLSAGQAYRNAELLATVYVANLLLTFENQSTSAYAQIQLVTCSHRMAQLARSLSQSDILIPVRHPRLLAGILRPDVSPELEKALTIVAATLDEELKNAEERKHFDVSTARRIGEEIRASWRTIIENTIIFSRSYPKAESRRATFPKERHRRLSEVQATRTTSSKEISPSSFGPAVLHAASIEIAGRLLETGDTDHKVCVEWLSTEEGSREIIIIPVTRHLRFAVRLSDSRILDRLSPGSIASGSIRFRDVKDAIDPRWPEGESELAEASFFQQMANRFALALDAMALANWPLARVICSYGVEQYLRASSLEKDQAGSIYVELLYVRQMALRALSAQLLPNSRASNACLEQALIDLEEIRRRGGDDLRISLSEILLFTERLVWRCATRDKDVIADSKIEARQLSITEILNRLVEVEKQTSKLSRASVLYKAYVSVHLLKYFMMLYMMTWSGIVNDSLTTRDQELFQSSVDWAAYLVKFRNALSTFRALAGGRLGSDQTFDLPLSEFLLAFGEIELAQKYEGDLMSDDFGTVTSGLSHLMEDLERMHESCFRLTERGFSRRVVRAAKNRLVKEWGERFTLRIRHKFSGILPVGFPP